MKEVHIILGTGNLGTALCNKMKSNFNNVYTYNRPQISEIIDIANNHVSGNNTVTVWNTEGYGSVPECRSNVSKAFEVHFSRNFELICKLHDNINLINFSTNYVNNLPKSEYASSKMCMEALTLSFPREKIITVRVANLYSKYFPMKSFQGRILKNKENISSLPTNTMIPTDCDWLSNRLLEMYINIGKYQSSIINIAPTKRAPISAHKFGEIVLEKNLEESVDMSRPVDPSMCSDIGKDYDWKDIWERVKPEFMERYNEQSK